MTPEVRAAATRHDRLDRWIEAVLGARLHIYALEYRPDLPRDPELREAAIARGVAMHRRWAHLYRLNTATCPYGGCLGPADGSECRHPDD